MTAELELARVHGDRRLYALDGIGTLRFEGLKSRSASAEAAGRRWRFERPRPWSRRVEATDETAATVASFVPRGLRRGGTLRWGDRELTLRPASTWRERYALADGDTELATFDGKGWGRRPVAVQIAVPVDHGLLLFAVFLVRGLAEDAGRVASVSASTA